jgi:acyl-CoA synthetase (AMP-forming)/AMP-acid ligase II
MNPHEADGIGAKALGLSEVDLPGDLVSARFLAAARRFSDRTAVLTETRSLTYEDLRRRAVNLASVIQSRAASPRVALVQDHG